MEGSVTTSSSTEDLSSNETVDAENIKSSVGPTNETDPVDLSIQCEQLKIQIETLTKELNEKKSAEKHASDERDKYSQMYNRINERFLSFERKQLAQMRRILQMLTSEQHKALYGKKGNLLNLPLL